MEEFVNIPVEAFITLGLYIVGSSVGFVWWMATITEQLKTLKELVKTMGEMNTTYARRDDMARELGVIEKTQETMWIKFEKLKEKVDSNGNEK